MSVDDHNREKLRQQYSKTWQPHKANLIYMISKYPIIYTPLPEFRRHTKLEKIKWNKAWKEISSKLDKSMESCKKTWRAIRLKYAKIMNLINTGKITKTDAVSHPEIKPYLDGCLSFLDPYLSEMSDERIPYTIHYIVNSCFELSTTKNIKRNKVSITHSQVKALLMQRQLQEKNDSENMDLNSLNFITTVIETAVKSKLERLLQINNSLPNPTNDIVNNNDENAVNVTITPTEKLHDEENTSEHVDFGLETELMIKDEDDIIIDHDDNNVSMEDDEDNIMNDEDINMEDEDCVSDAYIRNFFKELGETLSLELNLPEQKMLQSRINQLLKSMLMTVQS